MTNSQTSKRAENLAKRLEQGANELAAFARGLSDDDWQKATPGDGRTIGVIIHHVASSYPVEIQLAQVLASGQAITDVTGAAVDDMNAKHANAFAAVGKQETLELLSTNSKAAADAIRTLSDEKLDKAAPVSLNANAPLTTQFFIEDHALRHSFHHLARLKMLFKD